MQVDCNLLTCPGRAAGSRQENTFSTISKAASLTAVPAVMQDNGGLSELFSVHKPDWFQRNSGTKLPPGVQAKQCLPMRNAWQGSSLPLGSPGCHSLAKKAVLEGSEAGLLPQSTHALQVWVKGCRQAQHESGCKSKQGRGPKTYNAKITTNC